MPAKTIFENVRKFALIYGAGAIGALQALKNDLFSYPNNVKIYLGYFFSLVAVLCVFIAGSAVVDVVKKINGIIQQINEIDKKKPGDPDDDDILK